jgi:hypothetical protein
MPMASDLSLPHVIASPIEVSADACLTCPLCHTTHPALTDNELGAGGGWQCGTCGQRWDATRLATVAAYGAWVLEHDAVVRVPK